LNFEYVLELQRYALTLAEQLGLKGAKSAKPVGKYFQEDHLDTFREDQLAQLYELMLAASGKPEDQTQLETKISDSNQPREKI